MVDRKQLGILGYVFGAVTAAVIVICGIVVIANIPQAAAATQGIFASTLSR